MKIKNLIKNTLEKEVNFRERSRRYRGFYLLLVRDFYPDLNEVNAEQLIDFAIDFGTMTRSWNKVLEERPDLRGSDYNDKFELEEQAIRQLSEEEQGKYPASFISEEEQATHE